MPTRKSKLRPDPVQGRHDHQAQRDPRSARRSFVESANKPGTDFPIQNLPFGVFRPAPGQAPRVGVAIGDQIVDVAAAGAAFDGLAAEATKACSAASLNALMSLGPETWSALRLALSRALSTQDGDESIARHLTAMAQAEILLPVAVPNFTDFFASVFHATNAGRMFRPDNPLMPNYKYVPVAYHSRASSVRVSGTAFKRPRGQRKPPERVGAELRSVAQSRLRIGARLLHRHAERTGRTYSDRQGGRTHFRFLPAQRLVGPAMSRPGNISRSARSWRRIFPPRSRLGW